MTHLPVAQMNYHKHYQIHVQYGYTFIPVAITLHFVYCNFINIRSCRASPEWVAFLTREQPLFTLAIIWPQYFKAKDNPKMKNTLNKRPLKPVLEKS